MKNMSGDMGCNRKNKKILISQARLLVCWLMGEWMQIHGILGWSRFCQKTGKTGKQEKLKQKHEKWCQSVEWNR